MWASPSISCPTHVVVGIGSARDLSFRTHPPGRSKRIKECSASGSGEDNRMSSRYRTTAVERGKWAAREFLGTGRPSGTIQKVVVVKAQTRLSA